MFNTLLGFFISGLLFASGPCLASCGPIIISYMAATRKDVYESIFAYGLFSFARISVYLFLSILIFVLGQFTITRLLEYYSSYIFLTAGLFISLLGLLLVMDKKIEVWPLRWLKKYLLEKEKKNSVILGLVFGLLPCAPVLVLLSYIGLFSKTWLDSLLFSLAFGMGTFLSPLLFLAISTGLLPGFLKKRKEIYCRSVSRIFGLIIIFLGIQLMWRRI